MSLVRWKEWRDQETSSSLSSWLVCLFVCLAVDWKLAESLLASQEGSCFVWFMLVLSIY